MGSAASAVFGGHAKPTAPVVEKKSIQDDARSFYSKASAIKLLIRGEASRKAFRNYMEQTHTHGEVEYLDYFLQVEGIKKSNSDMKTRHESYMALIKEYETKATTTKHPVAVAISNTTHSWKGIETLDENELAKLMARSQEDVLAILTPNFEAFVASKYYLEWTKNQNTLEKKNSGSGFDTAHSGGGSGGGEGRKKSSLPTLFNNQKAAPANNDAAKKKP
jgi:Regulator of G protein signaling domain